MAGNVGDIVELALERTVQAQWVGYSRRNDLGKDLLMGLTSLACGVAKLFKQPAGVR